MDLDKRVMLCKQNQYEMNNFISEYRPFIANVVQKHVGRFVQYGKDDELSIGLIAFEEAVRAYNSDKGAFLSFAESVIKRRLIDHFRKESKNNNVIPISSFYSQEDEKEIDITQNQAIEAYNISQQSEYIRYEIIELTKELKEWGISFSDLPKVSPKHNETKKIYKDIINEIINNQGLLFLMKTKKYYPVAEIEKSTHIHRKKIERARKYVIAMVLILSGEYNYIQNFINWR